MIQFMTRRAPVLAGKIAISLPPDLLADVERLRRTTGETRSGLIRRALELLLGRIEREDMVREYVGGYLAHPESRAEIDSAMATASETLAEEPWE
jgi:metal-responsive CopG/Arc/MetJ family transcriptional regulator